MKKSDIQSLSILLESKVNLTQSALNTYINKLVALKHKIEDKNIVKLLTEYIELLKISHIRCYNGDTYICYVSKEQYHSRPSDHHNNKFKVEKLVEQMLRECKVYLDRQVPDWQVLAEKNGWKKG